MRNDIRRVVFMMAVALAITPAVFAATGEQSVVYERNIPKKVDDNGHPYDQVLTLQAGPYKPRAVTFTNWNNNTFVYDDATLQSVMIQLGWGVQLFRKGGSSFYLNENLAYSSFRLKLPENFAANPGNLSVTLRFFSFDTRLSQAWETFPVKALIPFWEAGFLYTLYSQLGTSDLLNGEGTAINFVAGAGLRYWINQPSSLGTEFAGRYAALPIFLTAKLNQIFRNSSSVDPSATTFLAGLAIGL